jgi:protein phosphatase methylesterase 1
LNKPGKTTHSTKAESEELSLDNLTNDCMLLLGKLFPKKNHQPTLILVGHSMGGSVVVSLCHALSLAAKTKAVPRVAGVVVLDVVEGTAMSALPVMKTIVSALPKGFGSVEEAIQWHLDSGTIVNAQSARRSVPSLLERNKNEAGGASETKTREVVVEEPMEELLSTSPSSSSSQVDPVERHFAYRWRANLLATEPYWSGWFQGLSQSFLSVKCARLLVLAGTDRLDKDLMIGQMQGKYQLIVFSDVGHSLQEDAPQRTAETLVDFWKRNESLNITRVPGGLRRVGQP